MDENINSPGDEIVGNYHVCLTFPPYLGRPPCKMTMAYIGSIQVSIWNERVILCFSEGKKFNWIQPVALVNQN